MASYHKQYVPSGNIPLEPFKQHYYRDWDPYLDQIRLYGNGKDGTPGTIGSGQETCFYFDVGFPTELSKKKGRSKISIQLSNENDEGLETSEGLMPKKKLDKMTDTERLKVLEEYNKYLENPKVNKEYDENKIPERMRPVDMDSRSFFLRLNVENDHDLRLFLEKLNDKLYEQLYAIRSKWPDCLKAAHKLSMINTIAMHLEYKQVNVGKDMSGISLTNSEKQYAMLVEKYKQHITDEELQKFSLRSFETMKKRNIVSDIMEIPEKDRGESKKSNYDRNFNVKIFKNTLEYQEYMIKKQSLMESLQDEKITKKEYDAEIQKCSLMFNERYNNLKSDVYIEERDEEDGEVYYTLGRIQDITPGCKLKLTFQINYIYITKDAVPGPSLRLEAICVSKPKKYSKMLNEDGEVREPEVALDFINLKKRKRKDDTVKKEESSSQSFDQEKVQYEETQPKPKKSKPNKKPEKKDDEYADLLGEFDN